MGTDTGKMKWQRDLGDATALGMMSFGVTTAFVGCVEAGFATDRRVAPIVWSVAICVGGATQMLAGVLECVRGNTFNLVMFVSYGVFWATAALSETLPFLTDDQTEAPSSTASALYYLLWCLLTLSLFFGAWFRDVLQQFVLLALALGFLLLTIGNGVTAWTGGRTVAADSGTRANPRGQTLKRMAGYMNIISGAAAVVYAGILLNGWPNPHSPLPHILRRRAERL